MSSRARRAGALLLALLLLPATPTRMVAAATGSSTPAPPKSKATGSTSAAPSKSSPSSKGTTPAPKSTASRRGAEVKQRGSSSALLGDYGTSARIVDWDQLPNGLLGVTIQGGQRFDLAETSVRPNGLVGGQVRLRPDLRPAPMAPQWQALLDVLRSIETHPHVQRMGLDVDHTDAWQVACSLIPLLPLEEALKYRMLGIDSIDELMAQLDIILNQISGED